MELRPLGATGIEISAIVFGAGAVGGAVFRGEPADRVETVRRALDAGVNWIDTAPGYGDGQSEQNLGGILAELGARPRLSTKVRLTPDELDDIPAAARASLDRSLQRLQRSHVDLIQLHNRVLLQRDEASGAVGIDDVLGTGGVADAFDELRRAGLADFAGFTALGDVGALHQIVESGRFQTAQVYHNVLNPSATRPVPPAFSALDYRELARVAAHRGVGVLNIRVLAAGAIGGQPVRGRAISPGSEPERDAERVARVAVALEDEPGTLAQQAIRFALGQRGISGVLVGFSNPEQVDDAVAAATLPPLGARSQARLEALYATDLEDDD